MSGLVEKLEAAEVGSRSLDLDIAQALSMKLWGRRHPHNNSHQWMTEIDGKAVPIPRYTTSLDAALALAERVIAVRGPIDISIMGSAQVVILDADPCRDAIAEAYGNTPALALCIAILRALNLNETRHAE